MVAGIAEDRSNLRRWWRGWGVGGVDHDAVVRQIAEDSGWSGRYAFLIVISAAISLLGLLMPSVAVLIGAMLLSPLMMPIIGLGLVSRPSILARSGEQRQRCLLARYSPSHCPCCSSRCHQFRPLQARSRGGRGQRYSICSSLCFPQ